MIVQQWLLCFIIVNDLAKLDTSVHMFDSTRHEIRIRLVDVRLMEFQIVCLQLIHVLLPVLGGQLTLSI